MIIGNLFLKVNLTGIITFSELDWITNQQLKFNRLEESIALKLGKRSIRELLILAVV